MLVAVILFLLINANHTNSLSIPINFPWPYTANQYGINQKRQVIEHVPRTIRNLKPTQTIVQRPFANPSKKYNYFGGPLLDKVQVFPIFYGNATAFQNETIAFYKTLVKHPYYYNLRNVHFSFQFSLTYYRVNP
jgi:hypothetical protein